MIDDFRAAYDWLSNFYRSEITYDGVTASTVEHAFQAAKAVGASDRAQILVSPSPGHAKRLGRKLQRIRPDWEDVKRQIMLDLLRAKFSDFTLRQRLLQTGDQMLVEGNMRHDNFWGACRCEECGDTPSENWLGILLMAVREELKGGVISPHSFNGAGSLNKNVK